jgi:pSer/pThr/pTyr-binding forkhead associated (FHA) protein
MKLRLIMNKGESAFSYDIDGNAVSVGRSAENDIQIHDNHVSRNHLVVRRAGRRYLVKDLGSGNGTLVNGHRIPPGATVEVKEGDAIVVGMSVFCLGEGSSGDLFALLDLIDPSKQRGRDTTTVIVEESGDMAA